MSLEETYDEDIDYEEEEEIEAALAEAGAIGGSSGMPPYDPSEVAVREAGGGESEGFEEAELELIERASHGDEQSAHVVLHHQGRAEEEEPQHVHAEADSEHSSELEGERDSA